MFLATLTTENKPRGITLHWVDPLAFCLCSAGTKLWCFDCMYVLYPPVRTTFEVPSEIIHFLAHIYFKGNHQNQIKSPKMTCWMWVRIQILSVQARFGRHIIWKIFFLFLCRYLDGPRLRPSLHTLFLTASVNCGPNLNSNTYVCFLVLGL